MSRVDEVLLREIEYLLTKIDMRTRLLSTLMSLGIHWEDEEDE